MPIARFQMPDGKIGRFEVPEGTTPEQAQSMIEAELPNIMPQSQQQPLAERGFIDTAGDVLANTGRMVVGGATGLAGILANPLNTTINYAGEALGFEPNLPTDVREQSLQQYDAATGGRGKPTDALGRIIQAGGEALTGGGIAGGIAKAAGAAPAIVEALGVTSPTTALAEIGGGAGAQAGMEANPESPLLSSLLGGVTGALAPTALASAPRGIAKGLGVNPNKVATLEKAGVPLNIPAVSDSNAVRSMSSASQNLIGGSKLRASMDNAYKKAEGALKDLGYTGTTTPEMAGSTVKQGLINWRNQKKFAFKNMDAAFDGIVPPTTKLNSKTFSDFADDSLTKIASGEGLTQQQIANRLSHPALQQLKSLSDAAKNGEPITLNALNEARKTIGELTAKSPLTPDFDSVITSKAYEALHQVRREAARAVGGEKAVKLLEDKNTFYRKYIDEEKSFNAKLVKKLGDAPEAVFQQITSGDKVGASNAKRTLARLNDVERDAFRDALIYQKGGAENFTIGKWAAEYGKMSKAAKSAFFMGKPSLAQAHDDLMSAVDVYKDLGRFKNTSNTAAHNFFNNILTGGGIGAALTGFTTVASGVAGGLAANKTFANLMASPAATRTLANILKNPPATESVLRTSLAKALKATGYTDDTAKQEIDAMLEESRQPALDAPNNPQNEPLTLEITPRSNTSMDFTRTNEGSVSKVYNDTRGIPTVGIGFNISDKSAPKVWRQAGLSPQLFNQVKRGEAQLTPYDQEVLFQASYEVADKDARAFYPDFDKLSQPQQTALVDMSYQMGGNRLKQFSGLHSALKKNDANAIYRAIMDSKYGKDEDTKSRAKEVANMLARKQ